MRLHTCIFLSLCMCVYVCMLRMASKIPGRFLRPPNKYFLDKYRRHRLGTSPCRTMDAVSGFPVRWHRCDVAGKGGDWSTPSVSSGGEKFWGYNFLRQGCKRPGARRNTRSLCPINGDGDKLSTSLGYSYIVQYSVWLPPCGRYSHEILSYVTCTA